MLVLAIGIGLPPLTGSAREPADGLQALLDARAAAVLEGDEDAFMATVDPGWNSRFIRRQRRMFRALQRVDLASYSLAARYDHLGDLVRPSDERHYPDAEAVSIPVTEERYRFRGFDQGEVVDYHYLTFVQEDGRWYIGSDDDLASLGFVSSARAWDLGPIQTSRQNGFLLVERRCGREACAVVRRDLIDIAVEARARVEEMWPPGWNGRVPIILPANGRELSRMIQGSFDPEEFVAFAVSSVDSDDDYAFTGHRVVLNPASFLARSRPSTVHIMAHEFLHVASRHLAGPFTPIWIEEGLAEYVGHADDPGALGFFESDVAAGRFTGRVPADFEFTSGAQNDIFGSYQRSYSAVRFLIERFGMRDFVRFYGRLGRVKVEAGTAAHHLDRVMEEVYGFDLEEFESRWAGSIAN